MRLPLLFLLGACSTSPDPASVRRPVRGDSLVVYWNRPSSCGTVANAPCPAQTFMTDLSFIQNDMMWWGNVEPGTTGTGVAGLGDHYTFTTDAQLAYDTISTEIGPREAGTLDPTESGFGGDVVWRTSGGDKSYHVDVTWRN